MTDETTAAEQTYTFEEFPEQIAVVRLGPGAPIPEWAESSSIFSVTATAQQTSLVCAARNVPTKARHERSFTAFALAGTREPGKAAGLYAGLGVLVEAGLDAFVLSTFDTEWILVRRPDAEAAAAQWRRRGHTVAPATPA